MGWPIGGVPVGGFVKRVKMAKAPTDITPFTADFRSALNNIPGDMIAPNPSIALARDDDGVVDMSVAAPLNISIDGTRLTVWLASGTVGHEYMCSMTLMSTAGQQLTRSFIIPVYTR